MAFRYQRRVDFGDTDAAGVMHFPNFFRFMEAAEVAFLRARGLNVSMMWEGEHLGFPRVSARCDYKKPARFDELIDIDVVLERLGTKSVTYAFTFSRDGEILAQGAVTSACCRVGPDRALMAIDVPASLRARLEGRGWP